MTTDSGYGQMKPADPSNEEGTVEFAFKQMIAQKRTSMAVKIVAVYDSARNPVTAQNTGVLGMTGYVDVLPLVKMIDGIGNTKSYGVAHGIPFARTQGGGNAVICDPQVGDIGIMTVSDRDIASVKATRAEAPPGSVRRMDIADGMYVKSLLNNGTPTQWVRFRGDGLEIVDKNGNKYVTTPQGITITDTNGNVAVFDANGMTYTPVGGHFKVVGSVECTGEVIAKFGGPLVHLSTHIHTPPEPPPIPGS